ncbi:sigma 54-interacting transcriptional regulator [Desulfovibrio aminophilus]|uniref:sigma-54 interaction domain-containing protein n=1 Tax=Desulfovibrio aminophilus TaxID=81425 RepID=UPI003390EF8D
MLPTVGPHLLKKLREALPFIARVTGGYATLTDASGIRLYTVDSEGQEHPDLAGVPFGQGKETIRTGKAGIVGSDFGHEVQSWVLPLNGYSLACSNIERVERDRQLLDSLRQALPIIARLVGGEAVLFDVNGRRIASYDHDGTENKDRAGLVSAAAAEAMRTNRPTVGPSNSEEGAVAVRFPVSSSFGFGFNNEQRVKREKILLDEARKGRRTKYNFSDIIGESEAIAKTCGLAAQVATGESSVVIYGETGTGKELFAQAIHNNSHRWDKPFVAINCGALPASIIESYLFGYESGAFTGARKGGSSGAFEQANGGTIFLDEVSEMDVLLQSKILRVLQEREIVRIGSVRPTSVDIRVLSATNRNLRDMVQKGSFREDLYYRLNVVQLTIPPLRERPEDIVLLVRNFIQRSNQLFGKFVFSISPEALGLLTAHTWPGNVRELQNCIEYSFNLLGVKERTILPQHLPRYLCESDARSKAGMGVSSSPGLDSCAEGAMAVRATPERILPLSESLLAAERDCLRKALEACNGRRRKAAALLGISTTTLWRRMAVVGLSSLKEPDSGDAIRTLSSGD